MQYMLLIHGEEGGWDEASEAERADVYERYGKLSAQMREHGHIVGGEELQAAASAKIVRVRDGETLVADGPFAETKEQLGGYYLVDCDLETALAYAAQIPGAEEGAIEVRPVIESQPS